MGRLKLVIGDNDGDYVESLADYLINKYPGRFQICSFTGREQLDAYFEKGGKADILLINPGMHNGTFPDKRAGITILLSDTKKCPPSAPVRSIFKYQRGDILAAAIMEALSGSGEGVETGPSGIGKRTRIIAVYSPAGGTGKTCISICSSVLCAKAGLSVFYLNMESISTTPVFFNCCNERNLSRVIYHLKEKRGNLDLAIESMTCVDEGSGVEFFSPPESTVELEELLPGELKRLLAQFREMGKHDIVFVDMADDFNSRTMALLEASDEVFLIVTRDSSCISKLKTYVTELDKLLEDDASGLWAKTTVILNKCRGRPDVGLYEGVTGGKPVDIKLAEFKGPLDISEAGIMSGINSGFYAGVNRLVSKYVKTGDRFQI